MMKKNLKKLNREVFDVVRERIKLLQANIFEKMADHIQAMQDEVS